MRIVIFVNGVLKFPELIRGIIREDDLIIAADGGLEHVRRIGLIPDLVIGDLDSLDQASQTWLATQQIKIKKHSPEKDETDLELAIQAAIEQKPAAIFIAGATGGRLDQTFANVMIMLNPLLEQVDVRLEDGKEQVFFIERYTEIKGKPGDRVSLLTINAEVQGIRTQGLKYSLFEESLFPGQTRGISNVMLEETAQIWVKKGRLLCVHTRFFSENHEGDEI